MKRHQAVKELNNSFACPNCGMLRSWQIYSSIDLMDSCGDWFGRGWFFTCCDCGYTTGLQKGSLKDVVQKLCEEIPDA